jgi:hypothetical protein
MCMTSGSIILVLKLKLDLNNKEILLRQHSPSLALPRFVEREGD